MLDSDLAILYQCKNGTKSINLAVNRNKEKFPEDFYFQLTEEECNILWFHFETANNKSRVLPHVFTQEGIAMLATTLRTGVAVEVSIQIMRTFVAIRKYISSNLIEQRYINSQVMKNTEDIKLLQESFSKLEEKEKNNHIFFEGQIYNAYSLLVDILSQAKENITIIDNYIDKKSLDILAEINIEVEIITKNINETAIEKYQSQYQNVSIKLSKSFHDRFIILDKEVLYHCGASFKDLGKECFAINKIEDKKYLEQLLEYLK